MQADDPDVCHVHNHRAFVHKQVIFKEVWSPYAY
jgi:hypothetical protein